MKNKFLILLSSAILCSLFFAACKKDDSTNPTNFIKIDDESQNVETGYIRYIRQIPDKPVYLNMLDLLGKGLTLVIEADTINDWKGVGNVLTFFLSSSASDGIAAGNYQYDSGSNLYSETYIAGWFGKGVNVTDDSGEFFEIQNGILKVERSNDSYQISFDGFTTDNKKVTAYYSGVLPVYKFAWHY